MQSVQTSVCDAVLATVLSFFRDSDNFQMNSIDDVSVTVIPPLSVNINTTARGVTADACNVSVSDSDSYDAGGAELQDPDASLPCSEEEDLQSDSDTIEVPAKTLFWVDVTEAGSDDEAEVEPDGSRVPVGMIQGWVRELVMDDDTVYRLMCMDRNQTFSHMSESDAKGLLQIFGETDDFGFCFRVNNQDRIESFDMFLKGDNMPMTAWQSDIMRTLSRLMIPCDDHYRFQAEVLLCQCMIAVRSCLGQKW